MYDKKFITRKVDKLCKLYDLSDPIDLFIILPQEMEIAEVLAKISNSNGDERKKGVMAIISGIVAKNKIKVPDDWIEVFIDTIDKASKGEYALNKEKNE